MPDPLDDIAARGVELHEQLRAFLIATMLHENAVGIGCALTYELASIVASVTETEEQALDILRGLFAMAAEQITTLGVGRPHP